MGLLRISYWIGIVTDLFAAIGMIFPSLGAKLYGLNNFVPSVEYRYAMGMGASLMLGWTALLLWANHKPEERKFVLLLTIFPVIAGFVVSEIYTVQAGFLPLASVLPTFVLQAIISMLFAVSYFRAR